jgi:glycosyltransferase involved in cell wall biosynthesis
MPMRILTVVSEAPPIRSGVARCVDWVTEGLRARGHEVAVVSCVEVARYAVGEFRITGLAAHLPRILRQLDRFDVVNVHGPAPTLSDLMLVALQAVPARKRPAVVYTHHSDIDVEGWELASDAYNRAHRMLARAADHVIVTTQAYRRRMESAGVPVTVVPWGVDLDRFNGQAHVERRRDPSQLRALFVGQMRPYKGLGNLIDAVGRQPGLSLTIVGSGPLEASYRERVARLRADNVEFKGRVSDEDLADLYVHHDAVVLPSVGQGEAFGLVLLEGMASGCVPVASDLPGVREVAGPTGVLVKPGDIEDLRNALLDLRQDDVRLRRLSVASKHQVADMGWSLAVDRYAELFSRAAGDRRRANATRALPPSWRLPEPTLRDLADRCDVRGASLLLFAEDRTTLIGSWEARDEQRADRFTEVARRSLRSMRARSWDRSEMDPLARSALEDAASVMTIPIRSRGGWLVVVLRSGSAASASEGVREISDAIAVDASAA